MNKLDNERNAKGVDSLLNFETVSLYSSLIGERIVPERGHSSA